MRILIITDAIPYPLISGAPLRIYNLLQRIARENDVWLAAFVSTDEQREGIAHLRKFCRAVETARIQKSHALDRPLDLFRFLLTGKPPELRFYHSEELARKIHRLASTIDFDIVQIEHAHMGLYFDVLPSETRRRTIWMLHDIDWSKYARMSRLEWKTARKLRLWLHSQMLRRWEPGYAKRFGRCITVSDRDRQSLKMANPYLQIDVVINGVDTHAYQPLPIGDNVPAFIFVGDMAYSPCADAAIWFCREVLPRVRQVVADVEMWIVGINPPPEVRRLDGKGVHVTGRVEDVSPYYCRSRVCVVPLRAGSGTRLKILEAMALGRPVVSTSIGCEGMDVTDGEHILIADDAEQFAEKSIWLLTDVAARQRVITRARELVEARYDWDLIARGLMRIYTQVADRRITH